MKINGCYTACLNDCSGILSKEHIISKSILDRVMNSTHNGVNLTFGKGNFIVRNLCEGHNQRLSPSDNAMKSFTMFQNDDAALYDSILDGTIPANINLPRLHDINARDFEKWMLKSAINYRHLMERKMPKFPYEYICNRFFKDVPFEYPYGLSIYQLDEPLRDKFAGASEFYYHITIDDFTKEEEIYGISVNAQGSVFHIFLPTENSHHAHKAGIEFNGIRYKIREHIPEERNEEEFGTPTLIWHPKAYRTTQLNHKDERIERSRINFDWFATANIPKVKF